MYEKIKQIRREKMLRNCGGEKEKKISFGVYFVYISVNIEDN